MKRMVVVSAFIGVVVMVSSCATGAPYSAGSVSSDAPDWRLDPHYGTVTLSSGFQPDPNLTNVLAGGSVDLSSIGFAGFVAQAPDLDLYYTAGQYVLFIYVAEEAEDTVLLVNDPSGDWHFSDDEIGTRPGIRFDNPQSGLYDIWVGTYDSGMVDATIAISEIPWDEEFATSDAPMPNWRLDPSFGSAELRAGFKQDPYVVSLIAGGRIDLSGMGYYGRVAEAPDFDLHYEAGSAPLYVYVSYAEEDTVLLINDPNGNWWFNDDATALVSNSGIMIEYPESGLYDIWVGTMSGNFSDANLVISEFSW